MKKAAVIGLGDIAPIHIGAIAANDEIQLCAVCDINPAAKERAPQGIPFYTDYKEMIQKEKPDCVVFRIISIIRSRKRPRRWESMYSVKNRWL